MFVFGVVALLNILQLLYNAITRKTRGDLKELRIWVVSLRIQTGRLIEQVGNHSEVAKHFGVENTSVFYSERGTINKYFLQEDFENGESIVNRRCGCVSV